MTKTRKLSGVFMIKGTHGLTRMVHTQDFQKRWSEWQAASPFPLHIMGMVTKSSTAKEVTQAFTALQDQAVAVCNPQSALQVLKSAFASRHIRGDWYGLDDQTLASLPLERPSVTYKLTLQAAIDTLEIDESNEKAPCTTPNVSIPPAPSVWAAVRYAQAQVAKRPVSDCEVLKMMYQFVVKWLVIHGREDVSVVLRFQQEYAGLIAALSQILDIHGDYLWNTCSGLVLHGEATFGKIAAMPSLLDDFPDTEYEAYFVYHAIETLLPKGCRDGSHSMMCIDHFEEQLAKGRRIEDFVGWSPKRLVTEFNRGG